MVALWRVGLTLCPRLAQVSGWWTCTHAEGAGQGSQLTQRTWMNRADGQAGLNGLSEVGDSMLWLLSWLGGSLDLGFLHRAGFGWFDFPANDSELPRLLAQLWGGKKVGLGSKTVSGPASRVESGSLLHLTSLCLLFHQ